MNNKTLSLTLFSFFLFKCISGDDDCRPASCGPAGPQIRFPFRLRGRQPSRCGFPGFHLSCDKHNKTLIKLPSSRSYVVKQISYAAQIISIDPDFCRRDQLVDFNLTGTPFDFSSLQSYTFLNCSSQILGSIYETTPAVPFPCLRSVNHTVIAVRTEWFPPGNMPAVCRGMATISVPIHRYGDIREGLKMVWFTPFCRSCELEGRTCGLNDGGETACFGSSSRGMPKSAKYGLSIGIGVPVLACLAGFACYIIGRTKNYLRSQNQSIDLFSTTVTPQPVWSTGLNMSTIESYPKIVIGESCRLPKDDDDGTCPICLSDYEPKEALRTIPECNHYFHADCIDEWLKLNATCPVCRNSPQSSSLVGSCSSMSSNSSISSQPINQ